MTVAWIILLLLAALVFILFELLTPTFGVLAALALAALVGAVWLAFAKGAVPGVAVLVIGLFGVPLYVMALVRWLPKSRMGKSLFLSKVPDSTGAGTPTASQYAGLVGKTGTAETLLRPGGAVRVEGQRVMATAEQGVIEKGATVKVISTDGASVVVRQVS